MKIAIDGYSSCGKSTLAKDLASKLKGLFVDTGSMYRATTLHLLSEGVNLQNHKAVQVAIATMTISLKHEQDQAKVYLNGKDVSADIRQPRVASVVSVVAAIPAVREELVAQQRKMGESTIVVMDGRDIGTVVFPDAEVKLFVTASIEERVRRRWTELKAKGIDISEEMVKTNLLERDKIDSSREHSPLRRAPDAYLLDNTHLSREEQLDVALRLVDIARSK